MSVVINKAIYEIFKKWLNNLNRLITKVTSSMTGKEDAANNCAHDMIIILLVKTLLIKLMMDYVLVYNCDNLQSFAINHYIESGTECELGALILEKIVVEYRKKSKVLYIYIFYHTFLLGSSYMFGAYN